MDVDSVMNTYDMMSLWNNLNQSQASSSTVPLISDLNSSVQENYMTENYFGGSESSELQDIYQQIEPDYGTGLTYDNSGNMNIPTTTTLPTNGLSTEDTNIVSLIQSGESSSELASTNLLNNYDALENGIYQSIYLSLYSNSDSSTGDTIQGNGSNLDTIV